MFSQLGVSASLQAIIERSAQEKEETGDWVNFDTLAHEAANRGQPVGIADEVFRLPGLLGHAASGEKISLTALGLVASGAAPRLSAQMARLAGICARRKYELKENADIGRQLLIDEYDFAADEAAEACELVQLVPGLTAGGQLGEDWKLTIFRGALDYLSVQSAADLLGVLEREAERRTAAAREAATRSAFLYEPTVAAAPASDERDLVFLSWGGDVSLRVATALQAILHPRLPLAEVFLSKTSIDPGDDPLRAMLDEGVLRSSVLVAALTAEAVVRPWVVWETASAWARGQLIIPVFIDVAPADVPGPLATRVQGVHLFDRQGLDRAIAVIASRLGIDQAASLTDREFEQLVQAANP